MSTKLYNIISALQAVDTSLWSKLSAAHNALYGYTTSGAVNAKFESVDSEITALKEAGGADALTGLVAGTGIETITVADHSATITVAGYDTLTGVISGFTADGSIKTAIDAAEKSAKDYTDVASGALKSRIDVLQAYADVVSGEADGSIKKAEADAKSYADTQDAALSTALENGATTYTTFKAVEDQIGAIDTYISGANGLQSQITANDGDISYISGQFDAKLAGVGETVTGYVANKISELSLDKAITGTVDGNAISFGVNASQQLTGALNYNADTLKVADSKLDINFKLSSLQSANDQTTSFAIVDGAGNKIGDTINIATESILQSATYSKAAAADDTNGIAVGDDILTLVFKTGSGTSTTVVKMKELINEDELNAAVTGAIDALSGKVYGADGLSATLRADINANAADIDDLSSMLEGIPVSSMSVAMYVNDLYNAALDSAQSMAEAAYESAEGLVSGAYTANKITVGATDKVTASEFEIGADTTDLLTAAHAKTVATEAAVSAAFKKYDESFSDLYAQIDALNTLIKG